MCGTKPVWQLPPLSSQSFLAVHYRGRCPSSAADLWPHVRGHAQVLHKLVTTQQAQPLGGGRQVQHEVSPAQPRVMACCVDRLLEGKQHGAAQLEGRLADSLGGVYGALVGRILQQADAEVKGDVIGSGDLVGSGAAREELAGAHPAVLLVPPDQLLQAGPAHALDKGTLHLADINGGVDGVAHIHHDVCTQHLEVTGQGVELNLRNRGAVGAVVEGAVAAKACDVGGRVKPMCRQVNARHIRQVDNLREGLARVGGPDGGQPLVDLAACVQGCSPIQVSGCRGCSG
mmetsp:Transcript_10831/g.23298  ORF Transcript_10831/g.23298 Transcript_10831/m.23298 type:complete len:287 (+) Transcript_10831:1327-2187(+)